MRRFCVDAPKVRAETVSRHELLGCLSEFLKNEDENGMDKIRDIGARGSSLQYVPGVGTADRPERSNAPLQLRIESDFPGLLRPVSRLREPGKIHQ